VAEGLRQDVTIQHGAIVNFRDRLVISLKHDRSSKGSGSRSRTLAPVNSWPAASSSVASLAAGHAGKSATGHAHRADSERSPVLANAIAPATACGLGRQASVDGVRCAAARAGRARAVRALVA
jgi:hypothetical protein